MSSRAVIESQKTEDLKFKCPNQIEWSDFYNWSLLINDPKDQSVPESAGVYEFWAYNSPEACNALLTVESTSNGATEYANYFNLAQNGKLNFECFYVGKAKNLKNRLSNHVGARQDPDLLSVDNYSPQFIKMATSQKAFQLCFRFAQTDYPAGVEEILIKMRTEANHSLINVHI